MGTGCREEEGYGEGGLRDGVVFRGRVRRGRGGTKRIGNSGEDKRGGE